MKKNIISERILFLLIIICGYNYQSFAQISTNDFVTTWKTDNPGTTNSTTIHIPTFTGNYNYDIDWNNDGIFDEFGKTGNAQHDYGIPGTYTIRIRGIYPQIYISGDPGSSEKILSVEQWGNISWQSMRASFWGAKNLVINANDAPDLSNVTSMYAMFHKATSFNQNINHWDVSNIKIMDFLFDEATNYNQPLNNWNVENVTSMVAIFGGTKFNQDISNWNVNEVQNMSFMFNFAENFNHPLDSWNVSSVTDMEKMFWEANSFNQPLNNWNVNKVTNMEKMFDHADVFNHPLNNWDVSNVLNMEGMFDNTDLFNQPLNNWNIGNVANMNNMFRGITLSTLNYDNTLIAWSTLALQNNVIFSGGNSTYCNGETARTNLINTFGWTITDGGFDCSTLAISSFDNNNIKIFPNPTSNIININTDNIEIKKILIYSVNGRLIKESKILSGSINLNNLSSGMYHLKLISDEGVIIKKLIKK